MHLIGQVIIGLLMIGGGVLLIKNNYQVANNMPLSFAERYMGGGGSYTLWKIIAIIIILAGFTVLFGVYDNILAWLISPLTNIVSPDK